MNSTVSSNWESSPLFSRFSFATFKRLLRIKYPPVFRLVAISKKNGPFDFLAANELLTKFLASSVEYPVSRETRYILNLSLRKLSFDL